MDDQTRDRLAARSAELRPHLEPLLVDLEVAALADPTLDGQMQVLSIQVLRLALEAGDPYLAAWYALQVGATSHAETIRHHEKVSGGARRGGEGTRKAPPDADLRAALSAKRAAHPNVSLKEARRQVGRDFGISYKTVERRTK